MCDDSSGEDRWGLGDQWGECLVVAAQVYNHFSEVSALYVIYIQPSLHIPFTVHMFYVQSLMTSFVGKPMCFL